MSSYVEFEAKTDKGAVEKACEELNITKGKLKYDIVSYGSSGIFGIVGVKKARIRVAVPNNFEEDQITTHSIPNNNSEESSDIKENKDNVNQSVCHNEAVKYDFFDGDSSKLGKQALQKIIDEITTDSTVSVKTNSNRIIFNVKSDNPAVLIGKRGKTLESIQYIVDKIVNKHSKHRIHILIDIEDYLENRKVTLQRLSIKLSQKAKETRRPVTIGQMNAHDRRIVHLALKDDGDIRTQSLGDGLYRKLVIYPKKNSYY